MYDELLKFLANESDFFIEAEAAPNRMMNFIQQYNTNYGRTLSMSSEGVILLQPDANKWGVELRLYVRSCPPPVVKGLGFRHNTTYRPEYSYRLNDNGIITALFNSGYRIGVN